MMLNGSADPGKADQDELARKLGIVYLNRDGKDSREEDDPKRNGSRSLVTKAWMEKKTGTNRELERLQWGFVDQVVESSTGAGIRTGKGKCLSESQ
uniref:Uncharacterized protein n=1 Tax=Nelumbo nucifera TaxID=4432 RepID=A0A822ZLH3_NELNU|nr:TPA_asm: hypothetical protein HUJ06_000828 [Nelumbo nucifera]